LLYFSCQTGASIGKSTHGVKAILSPQIEWLMQKFASLPNIEE
jgi:hypothetical protein